MKKANSKLYLENYCIMEQNEKLRKAAEFLENENQVLLKEIKQRLAPTAAATSTITAATTSEDSIRETDQSCITSASAASSSMPTKASKSRKKSKK